MSASAAAPAASSAPYVPTAADLILFSAIKANDIDQVILAVLNGASPLAKDEEGNDTDDIAAKGPAGPMREVLWLLSIGCSPLFCAACYNLTETAKVVVAKGGSDEAKPVFGATSGHHAVRFNNIEMIKLLGQAKVNLNVEGNNGYSPMSMAIWMDELKEEDRLPLVKAFIAAGVDVDAKGRKGFAAIHHAAWRDNKEILDALIAAGANVNLTTDAHDTPLDIATRFKSIFTIAPLVEAGGKKDLPKPVEEPKPEVAQVRTEESAINDVLAMVGKKQ